MVLIPDLNTGSGIIVLLKVKFIHNKKNKNSVIFLKFPFWIIATC